MRVAVRDFLKGVALLLIAQTVVSMVIPNATHLEDMLEKYLDMNESSWKPNARGKRAISQSDMQLIIDLHNKLRGQVYPPASNMEYMVSTLISHNLFNTSCLLSIRRSSYFWPCAINKSKCHKLELFHF